MRYLRNWSIALAVMLSLVTGGVPGLEQYKPLRTQTAAQSGDKPSAGVTDSPDPAGTSGTVMGDSAISANIRTAFATDKVLSALAIKVTTQNGEVQLSGFAKSETEKQRAADVAQATLGVRTVRNSIVVRP